jgi:hypothetical protein
VTAALATDIAAHARLSSSSFGSLLPDLPRCASVLAADYADTGLASLLGRPPRDWSDLSELAVRDVLEAGAERIRGVLLLAGAIREAATVGLRLAMPSPFAARRLDAPVRLLASWALSELGLTRYRELLDALESEPVRPPEVDDAWAFVQDAALADLGGVHSERFDAEAGLRRLLSFTPRELAIVEGRIYAGPERRTLDELGTELNVTRERIRQIEDQLKKKIGTLLESDEMAAVRRASERLRLATGVCVAGELAPEPVRWALGLAPGPSSEAVLHARVLTSLAGPFEFRDPWIVRAPAAALESATREKLLDMLDGGPVIAADAAAALAELGIPPTEHRRWIEDICRCREFDGLLIQWSGSMADKAVRVLELRGEPLSPEELAAALGPDTNLRSLTGQIQGDARFLRRGLKLYGLSAWGGEEYTTIQDEIAEEIERQGGVASLDYLVETLCSQFGVAASSVRAYASEPPFVRTADGRIAIGNAQPRLERTPIEDTRGCFRFGAHWSLRIVVDAEILRGSGRAIPPGVLQHLDMRPQDRRHLSTPVGPLLVNYGRQATIGSLRRAADSVGCDDGDRLFVVMTSDESVEFHAVHRDRLESLQGIERLAAELGAAGTDDPIAAVSYALGLPSDEYRIDAVRRRLRARKETDLLELVPDGEDVTADDDLLQDLIGDL